MPLIDHVNIMSYDLYSGYSKQTGHHTPLCSNNQQNKSADQAVNYLMELGVPANQIVIGAAFYGRIWKDVSDINNGLYQSGVFFKGLGYKDWDRHDPGFDFYRDKVAKAPYAYNKEKAIFSLLTTLCLSLTNPNILKTKGLKGSCFGN